MFHACQRVFLAVAKPWSKGSVVQMIAAAETNVLRSTSGLHRCAVAGLLRPSAMAICFVEYLAWQLTVSHATHRTAWRGPVLDVSSPGSRGM